MFIYEKSKKKQNKRNLKKKPEKIIKKNLIN